MKCCFCIVIQKNIQIKFGCVIVFLITNFNLLKVKKNAEGLFSAVECLIITKLITAERVTALGSDIFILCCDHIFYWFEDLIDQEFVNCVDEIDDCQIELFA